jgi:hypothetical protein
MERAPNNSPQLCRPTVNSCPRRLVSTGSAVGFVEFFQSSFHGIEAVLPSVGDSSGGLFDARLNGLLRTLRRFLSAQCSRHHGLNEKEKQDQQQDETPPRNGDPGDDNHLLEQDPQKPEEERRGDEAGEALAPFAEHPVDGTPPEAAGAEPWVRWRKLASVLTQRVKCAISGTFLTRPVKRVGLVAQFGSARPHSDFRGLSGQLSGQDDGGPAEKIGGGCIGGVVARDSAASYFET